MSRKLIVIGLALAALAFAACGDDDDSSGSAATTTEEATPTATETTTTEESSGGGGGGETLALAAPEDGSLKYDKTELSAKAGKVTINFDNPSQVPHAVEVEGNGVEEETDTITQSKASLTVDLKPGTYEYYCPVGNHEAAGMKGTLKVS